jgi:signal transduction histidine kinase
VAFAKTRTPASASMTNDALRDHIVEILSFIADDLETDQTEREQVAKSRGLGPLESQIGRSAAEIHASLRRGDGFNIDQMVSEYRALRASVVKQWTRSKHQLAPTDLEDLTRFNEAIDQAMAESVAQFTKEIDESRNIFLGVLGHDLRNPIGAASMMAQVLLKSGGLGERQTTFLSQIVNTTGRATQILNDLLDLTRSAFGNDIPITKAPMEAGRLARDLVSEMRALSNSRPIELEVHGDTKGEWDGARLGQVFSNLIGNALQHSTDSTPITVTVAGSEEDVVIYVHNTGTEIPPEKLGRLFESGLGEASDIPGSTHLGLGLYITSKIVMAHGGTITATSLRASGTTFIVKLPKR